VIAAPSSLDQSFAWVEAFTAPTATGQSAHHTLFALMACDTLTCRQTFHGVKRDYTRAAISMMVARGMEFDPEPHACPGDCGKNLRAASEAASEKVRARVRTAGRKPDGSVM
jgi:hypothetical protein